MRARRREARRLRICRRRGYGRRGHPGSAPSPKCDSHAVAPSLAVTDTARRRRQVPRGHCAAVSRRGRIGGRCQSLALQPRATARWRQRRSTISTIAILLSVASSTRAAMVSVPRRGFSNSRISSCAVCPRAASRSLRRRACRGSRRAWPRRSSRNIRGAALGGKPSNVAAPRHRACQRVGKRGRDFGIVGLRPRVRAARGRVDQRPSLRLRTSAANRSRSGRSASESAGHTGPSPRPPARSSAVRGARSRSSHAP